MLDSNQKDTIDYTRASSSDPWRASDLRRTLFLQSRLGVAERYRRIPVLYGMSLSFPKTGRSFAGGIELALSGKNKSSHERSIDESDVKSIEL